MRWLHLLVPERLGSLHTYCARLMNDIAGICRAPVITRAIITTPGNKAPML